VVVNDDGERKKRGGVEVRMISEWEGSRVMKELTEMQSLLEVYCGLPPCSAWWGKGNVRSSIVI
jgi:hypothetical protein